jgi:archaemetzincin
LGHLFNLFHCEDNKCLMHFSGDLEDLDRTPLYFCRYCSAYYKDARSGT